MGNLSLYEITDDYLAALQTLESLAETGQLSPEVVADTIEGLSGDLEVKAKNVIGYAKSLEAESDAIKAATEPMLDRAAGLRHKAEWMRHYVQKAMERTGITEIKSPYFVIKLKDNPGIVVIDCEAGLPDYCWREVPATREPNKQGIKAMLVAGDKVVSAAAHIEKGKRLEVK